MGNTQAKRRRTKRKKRSRLKAAENHIASNKWNRHTAWHWSMMIDGARLDYWPSTGKWMIMGVVSKDADKLEEIINPD